MKTNFFILILAFLTFSCSNDNDSDIESIDEVARIIPNSEYSNLLSRVAANSGRIDNVLDNSDCVEINLPVIVDAGDLTFAINSIELLHQFEDLYADIQSNDPNAIVELTYPITITLLDHSQIVVNNSQELLMYAEDCDESPIENADFQYPITIVTYDSDSQVIDSININDDSDFYDTLDDVDNGDVNASMQFPITVVVLDDQGNLVEVEVNSDSELQSLLSQYSN